MVIVASSPNSMYLRAFLPESQLELGGVAVGPALFLPRRTATLRDTY